MATFNCGQFLQSLVFLWPLLLELLPHPFLSWLFLHILQDSLRMPLPEAFPD